MVEAAEQLWAERGFDAVSVEDICLQASVAKGTFYFYFPRKEHLLVTTVFGHFLPREAELQLILASSLDTGRVCTELLSGIGDRVKTLDRRLVLRAVEESFRHYRQMGKAGVGDRSLHVVYQPVFERGVARGDVHPSWRVGVLARTLGWATLQEIFMWGSRQTTTRDLIPNLRQRAELVANGADTERPRLPIRKASADGRARRKQALGLKIGKQG